MPRCTFEHGMDKLNSEKSYCQKWDSNPRLQSRLRPERSALDRSAILTIGIRVVKAWWVLWGCREGIFSLNSPIINHDKIWLAKLIWRWRSGNRYTVLKSAGPTEIRTRIAGFKVQSANHYTIGPGVLWSCLNQDLSQNQVMFVNLACILKSSANRDISHRSLEMDD